MRQNAAVDRRWDGMVLQYFISALALPPPAIMDVFDDDLPVETVKSENPAGTLS